MPEIISSQKLSYNLSAIAQVVNPLISAAGDEKIWLFFGDLGAGKTTLIKELCLQLGVDENSLSSPTFSIINEYEVENSTIYHFDFYRLKNETEILDLGIEEYFESGNYCFVEWPERLGSILPEQFFKISIASLDDENSRTIEFEKHA